MSITKSQNWNTYNSYSDENEPEKEQELDELLYTLLNAPEDSLRNSYLDHPKPITTSTTTEKPTVTFRRSTNSFARQAVSRRLDNFLLMVRDVLRRNAEAIIAVKEFLRIIFNYLMYVVRLALNQFNKWTSYSY